uniref:Uncharacterized protein n=1 Tax=Rhizophora mucronata TaxID=61149 RepID=A0A2P2R1I7_RHIMU
MCSEDQSSKHLGSKQFFLVKEQIIKTQISKKKKKIKKRKRNTP